MAATKTSRNDTPKTPDVNESKIAAMKVGELRRRLKDRGVGGTEDLKKPDLVKKLIKVEAKGVPAKKPTAKKSISAKSGSKDKTSRDDTRKTRGVSDSKIAAMKVDELRRELKSRGVKGTAGLKKADLVKKLITSSTAKSGSAASKKSSGGGGKRTGKATSDSLKYSQEIRSKSDKPERPGRSLVPTDHEVIRQWAEARKAVPATVA